MLAAYEKVLVGDRSLHGRRQLGLLLHPGAGLALRRRADRPDLAGQCVFRPRPFKMGALIGREVAAAIAGAAEPESLTRWASGLEV